MTWLYLGLFSGSRFRHPTVGQNNQEYRMEYWATRLFARTAHWFASSALLTSLARSEELTHLLADSLPTSWDSD